MRTKLESAFAHGALLAVILLGALPLAAAQAEQDLPVLTPGVSPVEYLPRALKGVEGSVVSYSVGNAEMAAKFMAGCAACTYLASQGEVRIWEAAPPAQGNPSMTLEAFVREGSAALARLRMEGKEALVSYGIEYRLPPEEARVYEEMLREGARLQRSTPPPEVNGSVVFQDGFEDPALSAAKWTAVGGGGSFPEVTKCSAYAGAQSLDMVRGGSQAGLGCTAAVPGSLKNYVLVKDSQLLRGATAGTVKVMMSQQYSGSSQGTSGGFAASINGSNWYSQLTGSSSTAWTPLEMNVRSWLELDLTKYKAVLVGLAIDTGTGGGWGARFDNFEIFTDYTGSQKLTVSKAGNGEGTILGSGIDCGSVSTTCSSWLPEGQSTTLIAIKLGTSTFAGWGGDCSGTETTCKVTMSAARNVTATFDPAPTLLALEVKKTGTGGGTVKSSPAGVDCGSTCNASFSQGTNVDLTATPDATSIFLGWSGACSGFGTCRVEMTQARSATASFASAAACPPIRLQASQVEVKVAYANPYTGTGGCATPIPQTDSFAYFYYDSKENPEVFTKALDFGSEYKIFFGGLTDFGVSAYFTNLKTGVSKVLTKEPKTFNGDGGGLSK